MQVLGIIAETFVLVLGSLMAALLLCAFLLGLFRLLRRPGWGPSLTMLLVPVPLFALLPASEFARMTSVFAMLLALPLWAASPSEARPAL